MDDAQRIQRSTRIIQLTTVALLLIAAMSLGFLSGIFPKIELELIRSRVYEQATLLDFGQPRGELKPIDVNGSPGFRQRFDRGTIVYHKGRILVLPHPVIPDRQQVQVRAKIRGPRTPRGGTFFLSIWDVW